MYYNLNNKKQRKQFWKECERALLKCSEALNCSDTNKDLYSWDKIGKKMSPYDVFDLWDKNELLWSRCIDWLDKKALDTINYYELNDPFQLDGYIN